MKNCTLLLSLFVVCQSFGSQPLNSKKRSAEPTQDAPPAKRGNATHMPVWMIQQLPSIQNSIRLHTQNDISYLVEAMKKGHIDVAKKLIHDGIDLTQKDNEFSILALAIQHNTDGDLDGIIQLLIEKGATIAYNSPLIQGCIPSTPLQAALYHYQNSLAKQFITRHHLKLSEKMLHTVFISGNQEMAHIILSTLPHLNDLHSLRYDPKRITLMLSQFVPANIVRQKVFNAYKIKQMMRAKEIESLEIE